MPVIKELDLLVHPDFDMRGKPGIILPHQEVLRERWEERAWDLKSRKHAALVYVSALSGDELEVGLQRPKLLANTVAEADIERIQRWNELLGSRLVVFPDEILLQENVTTKLADQQLQVAGSRVRIEAYGEFADKCVRAVTTELREALSIPAWNTGIIGRLSITQKESDRLRNNNFYPDFDF